MKNLIFLFVFVLFSHSLFAEQVIIRNMDYSCVYLRSEATGETANVYAGLRFGADLDNAVIWDINPVVPYSSYFVIQNVTNGNYLNVNVDNTITLSIDHNIDSALWIRDHIKNTLTSRDGKKVCLNPSSYDAYFDEAGYNSCEWEIQPAGTKLSAECE